MERKLNPDLFLALLSFCLPPTTGAEPLPFMSWDMASQLAGNAVESYVLFGAVAGMMDFMLRTKLIRPFR